MSLLFCGCKPCNSGENGGLDIKGEEESVKERKRRSNAEVSEMSLKRARARGRVARTLLASAGQLIKQFSGYHLRLPSRSSTKKKCYGTVNGFLMNKHQQS